MPRMPLTKKMYRIPKGLTQELPVREKKLKRKEEDKTVFLLVSKEGKIAVRKRNEKGVLNGMYEFPNSKGKVENLKVLKEILKQWNLKGTNIEEIGKYQHIFTHITWKMIVYKITVEKENKEFIWVSKEQLEKDYALPTAFKKNNMNFL